MMTSSPPKRDRLLETARSLFYKHGIRRVTVEEICRTAGVSKVTFYKYFENKIDLAKALIVSLVAEKVRSFEGIMRLDLPYPEKMEKLVAMRLADAEDVSREFLQELYQSANPEIRDLLQRKTAEVIDVAIKHYTQAQRDGYIRPDIKPEFLMWLLNHMIDMVGDESLVRLYGSTRELTAELINFFLYGIINRERE